MPETASLWITHSGTKRTFLLDLGLPGHAGIVRTVMEIVEDELHLRTAVEGAIKSMLISASSGRPTQPKSLDTALTNLTQGVLPVSIRDALGGLGAGTPLVLVTDQNEVPWELLRWEELCLFERLTVARQCLLDKVFDARSLAPTTLSAHVFSNPTGDLKESSGEAKSIVTALRDAPEHGSRDRDGGDALTTASFLRALREGRDVVHYAGHAKLSTVFGKAEPVLVLSDGQVRASHLAERSIGQPFVFLNACRSDAIPDDISAEDARSAASGLSRALISAGARAVIATQWRVLDTSSCEMAKAFYREALTGVPLAQALRKVCMSLREQSPGDPTWASYIYYGHPDACLVARDRAVRQDAVALAITFGADMALAEQPASVLLDKVSGIVAKHDGMVVRLDLDSVLACFAPVFSEAKVREAVRAAWDMRQALDGQAGVALCLGQLSLSREKFDGIPRHVTGMALNRALLASREHPGMLVADHGIAHMAHDMLTMDAAAPWRGSALHAIRGLVEGDGTGRHDWDDANVPLVGRKDELDDLGSWLDRLARRPRLVGIHGPMGIGKTRLVNELRARCRKDEVDPMVWRTVSCPPPDARSPLSTIAGLLNALLVTHEGKVSLGDAIHRLTEAIPDADANVRGNLIQIVSETLGLSPRTQSGGADAPSCSQDAPNLLAHALYALLRLQWRAGRVVVVLDDLHHIDRESLSVLRLLVAQIRQDERQGHSAPVAILGLYRDDEPAALFGLIDADQLFAARQEIRELSSQGRLDMLRALLGGTVPALLVEKAEQLSGNPLLLREQVWLLRDRGILVRPGARWDMTRPLDVGLLGDIGSVVLARASALGAEFRLILDLMVLAGQAPLDVIQHAAQSMGTDAQAVQQGLDVFFNAGLLARDISGTVYEIQHSTMGELLKGQIDSATRRRLHLGLARAYAQREGIPPDQTSAMADHYALGLTRTDSKGRHIVDAGEEYDAALHAVLQAGHVRLGQGRARDAARHFGQAVELLESVPQPDVDRLVQALVGLGRALLRMGDFPGASEADQRAWDAVENRTDDPVLAAGIARRIGRSLGFVADDDALMWMGRALSRLGDDLDGPSVAEAALVHAHTGTIHYYRGDLDRAQAEIEAGLGLVKDTEFKDAWGVCANLMGAVLDARSLRNEATEWYAMALDLFEELGDEYQVARVKDNLGVVQYHLGNWAKAATLHEEAKAYFQSARDDDQTAYARINLGNVHLALEMLVEAEYEFDRARWASERVQNWRIAAIAHLNLAHVAVEREDWGAARERVGKSWALIAEHHVDDLVSEARAVQGKIALAEQDAIRALALAVDALVAAKAAEAALEQGQALRLLGRAQLALGQTRAAITSLRHSRAQLQGDVHPPEVARTEIALAQALRAAGSCDEADTVEAAARALLMGMRQKQASEMGG